MKKRIAKFWVEQLGNLRRRLDMASHNYAFITHVYYRNKSGKLAYIWGGFNTYDEASDFIFRSTYSYKDGREVYVGWDSKVRIGFTIEGDKGSGYQLISYCLPYQLDNAILGVN